MSTQHGYNESDGIAARRLLRDTRTPLQQLGSVFSDPLYVSVFIIGCTVACFLFPAFYPLLLILLSGIMVLHLLMSRREHLAMEMPSEHPGKDYNNPEPGGHHRFKASAGRYYHGNTQDGYQLWSSFARLVNHVLALGATGSGKTEYLISLASNALMTGSGFIFTDPKAAETLYPRLYTITRRFAREDDLRVLAFHINQSFACETTSNSINLLKNGSARELANLIIGLSPQETNAKNPVFYQNGQNLIRSFFLCWTELRDLEQTDTSVASIRNQLTVSGCIALINNPAISETSRAALKAFLAAVGYNAQHKEDQQPASLMEQFGYAVSYFSNTLNLIVDSYGHLFNNTAGELNIADTFQRQRIMVALIPSLGLSAAEVKNLGLIVLANIRMALGALIDPLHEGEVHTDQASDHKPPFPVIVDEYAAIGVRDFIVTVTQARFMGVAAVIGAQDYAGIKGIDAPSAQQLVENTRFKLIFRMETATDTFKLVNDIAGQVTVMETTGFEADKHSLTQQYYDKHAVSKQSRNRIHIQDLIAQTEGQFHGLYNGRLFRAHGLYTDIHPTASNVIRINQLIQPHHPAIDQHPNPLPQTADLESMPTQTEKVDPETRQSIADELIVAFEIGQRDSAMTNQDRQEFNDDI